VSATNPVEHILDLGLDDLFCEGVF